MVVGGLTPLLGPQSPRCCPTILLPRHFRVIEIRDKLAVVLTKWDFPRSSKSISLNGTDYNIDYENLSLLLCIPVYSCGSFLLGCSHLKFDSQMAEQNFPFMAAIYLARPRLKGQMNAQHLIVSLSKAPQIAQSLLKHFSHHSHQTTDKQAQTEKMAVEGHI